MDNETLDILSDIERGNWEASDYKEDKSDEPDATRCPYCQKYFCNCKPMDGRYKIELEQLTVEVLARATREAFGRTLVYVEPIAGHGGQWVNKDSLK